MRATDAFAAGPAPSHRPPRLTGARPIVGAHGRKITLTSQSTQAVRRFLVPASIPMVNILGPGDEFLLVLERELAADVHVRGNEVTFAGSPDAVALRAVLTRAGDDRPDRPGSDHGRRRAGRADDGHGRCAAVGGPDPGRALHARPDDPAGRSTRSVIGRHRRPAVVFGIGPAGTGKTYLAMAKAVQALQAKRVNRILTRPGHRSRRRLGFLPGTLNDKIDPYLRPPYDALRPGGPRVGYGAHRRHHRVAPLAYMPGGLSTTRSSSSTRPRTRRWSR